MAETTDPDDNDFIEIKSDGTRKRWALILGNIYRPFYYSSHDDAYKVIVDTFKATWNTPIDREVGEIYQLWNNERRLVEMYFNIDGIPRPSPAINDTNFPWKQRRRFEIPSKPKNSVFSFLVKWEIGGRHIQGRSVSGSGFQGTKKFHITAFNYEIARKQLDAEVLKTLRAARVSIDTGYHVTYLGVSNR